MILDHELFNSNYHVDLHPIRLWLGRVLWTILPVVVLWLASDAWRQQQIKASAARGEFEQRQRAELIILSSPTPTIACDNSHHVTVMNLAAERLLGWSFEEMSGQPIEVFIPEDLRDPHRISMESAAERMKKIDGDWVVRRSFDSEALTKDGRRIPITLEIRTIKYGPKIEFIANLLEVEKQDETPTVIKLPKLQTPPPTH